MMDKILAKFLEQKEAQLPIKKRLKTMYDIVSDLHFNHTFTKTERLFATSLIKKIIEELNDE